ncbi:hypothetical protein ACEWY4_024815 [Coilia grayii]|uniref:Uncharacterized protein n=1 Tax=Coilia grayii TaxID=363190 RepID=A0ABD1IYW1_9TELE
MYRSQAELSVRGVTGAMTMAIEKRNASSHQQVQGEPGAKRPRTALGEEEKQRMAKEICDNILAHTKERFSFTDHLVSATLLQGDLFGRIKTFLRNSMGQERLNALAMLSMERKLVLGMADFNERVIDCFAALKERRSKFQYK